MAIAGPNPSKPKNPPPKAGKPKSSPPKTSKPKSSPPKTSGPPKDHSPKAGATAASSDSLNISPEAHAMLSGSDGGRHNVNLDALGSVEGNGPVRGPRVDGQAVYDRHKDDREAGNREVTQSYHELANDLDDTLNPEGSPESGNNWAGYAAWASNSVGSMIRDETVPPPTREALAEGNRDVYRDIAPHIDSFNRTFGEDQSMDREKYNEWAEQQREINQGSGFSDELDRGFSNYYQARFETDPDRKQELVFAGNIDLAAHEQDRLDGQIDQAQSVGTAAAADGLVSGAGDVVAGAIGSFAASGILSLPDGGSLRELRMDRDLEGNFAGSLQDLDSVAARRAVNRHDPDADSLEGTGTENWGAFDQRMEYITDLMRTQHNNSSLLDNPRDYPDPQGPTFIDHAVSIAEHHPVYQAGEAVYDGFKTAWDWIS